MVNMEQLGIPGRAAAGRRDFPNENGESRKPSTQDQREELIHYFSVLPGTNSTYLLIAPNFLTQYPVTSINKNYCSFLKLFFFNFSETKSLMPVLFLLYVSHK